MTTLIFGKDGQIGKALQFLFEKKVDVIFLGRQECDLSDVSNLKQILQKYQPKIIINTSAYTAVDKAEIQINQAFAVNAIVPEVMAKYIASQVNGLFIHYSTDYVFADSKDTPYREDDETGMEEELGVYGKSKLAGEKAIFKAFNFEGISSTFYILRTSWVYGDGENFIKKIFHLAQDRHALSVVADQHGAPTSAVFLAQLAEVLLSTHHKSLKNIKSGIYHAVPHGYTSWYGLARFIIRVGLEVGVPMKLNLVNIKPIPAKEYPVAAPRPYNSLLSNAKLHSYLSEIQVCNSASLEIKSWQTEVEKYVRDLFMKRL